jgi:integrase
MFDAASTSRDRMLVVALAGWGLRAGEVAALHQDQLHLDADDPYIQFDERKNGPGTVAIVYGEDIARRHLSRVDGYLFPSELSKTGHVNGTTIAGWFHDLADRAEVPEEIDGVARKPHMGRRFWYDAYSQTTEDLLKHVQDIADEQGSASAKVVFEDYLTDERKRELRREFMREKLSAAFDTSNQRV